MFGDLKKKRKEKKKADCMVSIVIFVSCLFPQLDDFFFFLGGVGRDDLGRYSGIYEHTLWPSCDRLAKKTYNEWMHNGVLQV